MSFLPRKCSPNLSLFFSPATLVSSIPCASDAPCPEPLPSLCPHVLALPSLPTLGNAFSTFISQPEHIPSEKLFLATSHPPFPPMPLPYLSESCHRSQRASCLFRGPLTVAVLHLFMSLLYVCLYFLIRCRLCQSRKPICFCSPWHPPCLVQGLAVVDLVIRWWDGQDAWDV